MEIDSGMDYPTAFSETNPNFLHGVFCDPPQNNLSAASMSLCINFIPIIARYLI